MKKKKVVIVSPTGMLGSMVYHILKEKYDLILLYRNKEHLEILDKVYGGVGKHTAIRFDLEELYKKYLRGGKNSEDLSIKDVDAVINCAGVIKPYADRDPALTFFINSAFPQLLSSMYKEKLIQITTDCVFNGIKHAPYNENSLKSSNDLYGLSKSLGEPSNQSLVLRTSIIGPEIHGFVSLISWLKKQTGEVTGFTNHYWNGITTKQFALICNEIISHRKQYPKNGLFHIFSNDITKYEMLIKLKEKYKLTVTIKQKKADAIDRRLRTIYDFTKQLHIPNFDKMIEDL